MPHARRSTVEERIQLNSHKNARQKELRKEEGRNFGDTIADQMRKRAEEAKRKVEAVERARLTELRQKEEQSKRQQDEGSSEDEGPRVVKKRKKPGFM
jgi:hypothetical protein